MEILTKKTGDLEIVALTRLDEVTALIRLFEDIAEKEGWQPDGHLRDFMQGAVYFGAVVSGALVGGLQLVRPSATGALPCHEVWPELHDETRSSDAHVVIMALDKRARGTEGLLWNLTAEVWKYCTQHMIERLWIEATAPTFRIYQRLGWPLRTRGPARTHWGEECTPAVVSMGDVAASIARRARRSPQLCSLVLDTLQGLSSVPDPRYAKTGALDGSPIAQENENVLCP